MKSIVNNVSFVSDNTFTLNEINDMNILRPTLLAAGMLALTPFQALMADNFNFDFAGSMGEKGGHTRYVAPLSNPLFNETPYITTEVRPIYFHQKVPNDFVAAGGGGGTIDVYAVELRLALTDRLGIIASKDGYADIDFAPALNAAGLNDETGFANISIGLKYAVVSDPSTNTIITVGAEYEPTTGNLSTGPISLQGDGDGFIDLFVTGATTYDKIGVQGNIGTNLAIDTDHDSSILHYSGHLDYAVTPNFFPLVEINGFTTIDNGTRTAVDFEGIDLVNFGAADSGTVVTMAVGARYRMNKNIIFGVGYEEPVTSREDLMDSRVYADMIIHM